ncbi:cysteine synthase family protein [Candidatus Poribacteria bacterium]|nr:cysteine synthase family protein [Candidatus Poribacteria bacterium]
MKPCGVHADSRVPDEGILTHIGNTPLLRLRRIPRDLGRPNVELFAKAEWFNPGGSVKDRAALRMIEDAERSGALTPDKVVLDSTSGNTGIAYALICAVKGYRCELVMPGNVSQERLRTVRAYGASVTFSDPLEGSDGALLLARSIYETSPDKYYLPCQYDNDSNWRAHYDTTGVEILKQTNGRVTHLLAGVGTSGTVMGTGRRLKECNDQVRVYAVEPDSGFHGLEGLKHIETAIVPGIYDPSVLDGTIHVGTEEAYDMSRRLAAEEGILVGKSAGAVMVGAMRLAGELDSGVVVCVFADGGSRYLSSALFEE